MVVIIDCFFENDLIHLSDTFYINSHCNTGYDESEVCQIENKKDFLFPKTLRQMYKLIGKDKNFMISGSKKIYDLSQVETIRFIWESQEYIGIEFASVRYKMVYFENMPYCRNRQVDIIQYIQPNDWQWSSFDDATSEIIYTIVSNAKENMQNILSIKSSDIENTLKLLKEQWGLVEFQSFNQKISKTLFDVRLMYSIDNHLLLIYDSDEKNKIIISSNSIDKLLQIESLYKIKWLKKSGLKIISEKLYCNELPLNSFEEKLHGIYNIYFGKNIKIANDVINKFDATIQKYLPDEIKNFYEMFYCKSSIINGAYNIIKPQDMKFVNNEIMFAEEEQRVCKYIINLKDKAVYYVDDDKAIKEQTSIGDFLLYLLVIQGTSFMNAQGLILKSENFMPFFNSFKAYNVDIYINLKRRIIGYEYDDHNIYLMSKNIINLEKFEQDSGIFIQYL